MSKVAVNPDLPLKPGVYEINSAVPGRDLSKYTYKQFEQGIKQQYGDFVDLINWGINGGVITAKIRVNEQPAGADANAMVLPYIIAATVVVAGFFLWRISVNAVKILSVFKETVDDIGDKPIVQAGLGGAGLGIMFGGAALVILVISQSGKKRKT